MPLASQLFAQNARLQSALLEDKAHVTLNSQGEHVRLIQIALVRLGENSILGKEYTEARYGTTTAAAVKRFKAARRIINFSYQRTVDDIVGKMTIKALDDEMIRIEHTPTL